jgi:hypothetical protein
MSFGQLLERLCTCAVCTSALSYVTLYCGYLRYGTLLSGRLNNDYQTARYETEDQIKSLL